MNKNTPDNPDRSSPGFLLFMFGLLILLIGVAAYLGLTWL